MTTIADKKKYPSEQYLNELLTNVEFAARAPVEIIRVMAAELQKRRKADSAELVVPDEMAGSRVRRTTGFVAGYTEGWNACRAAMLQGSQPVSQTPQEVNQ